MLLCCRVMCSDLYKCVPIELSGGVIPLSTCILLMVMFMVMLEIIAFPLLIGIIEVIKTWPTLPQPPLQTPTTSSVVSRTTQGWTINCQGQKYNACSDHSTTVGSLVTNPLGTRTI